MPKNGMPGLFLWLAGLKLSERGISYQGGKKRVIFDLTGLANRWLQVTQKYRLISVVLLGRLQLYPDQQN
jgi:hypothetical protein